MYVDSKEEKDTKKDTKYLGDIYAHTKYVVVS
jgi:hypothetical protein